MVCVRAGAVYSNLARDSGGIQNRLGSLAFMVLYLGVMGLSSLPIWRAERLLFIRCAGAASSQSPSACCSSGALARHHRKTGQQERHLTVQAVPPAVPSAAGHRRFSARDGTAYGSRACSVRTP